MSTFMPSLNLSFKISIALINVSREYIFSRFLNETILNSLLGMCLDGLKKSALKKLLPFHLIQTSSDS